MKYLKNQEGEIIGVEIAFEDLIILCRTCHRQGHRIEEKTQEVKPNGKRTSQ